MKSDLDRLMRERKLDAIIVTGGEEFNAARYYLSNGAQITHGTIFKLVGRRALLVCSRMELEEAAKSGLEVLTDAELGYHERLKDAEGDGIRATALFWSDVLARLGLREGRIGLYGAWQVNKTIALYKILAAALAQFEFVAEADGDADRRSHAHKRRRRDPAHSLGGAANQCCDGKGLGVHRWLAGAPAIICLMARASA